MLSDKDKEWLRNEQAEWSHSESTLASFGQAVAEYFYAAGMEAGMAEQDALRKDAERYRWMRDHIYQQNGGRIYALPITFGNGRGENVDAVIDAALAAEGGRNWRTVATERNRAGIGESQTTPHR